MFLHAHTLVFEHPESGARLQLTAPLDGELEALLERLGKAD
jgi:hypothetical protein